MTRIAARHDVVLVGGGPAGSTVAAFLARAGLAVAPFERERFPRGGVLREAGTFLVFEFTGRYYDPSFLDVFFMPRPPAVLKDAVTTVFAGGVFLDRPLWLRARLAAVRLAVQYARWRRQRRGLPIESRVRW